MSSAAGACPTSSASWPCGAASAAAAAFRARWAAAAGPERTSRAAGRCHGVLRIPRRRTQPRVRSRRPVSADTLTNAGSTGAEPGHRAADPAATQDPAASSGARARRPRAAGQPGPAGGATAPRTARRAACRPPPRRREQPRRGHASEIPGQAATGVVTPSGVTRIRLTATETQQAEQRDTPAWRGPRDRRVVSVSAATAARVGCWSPRRGAVPGPPGERVCCSRRAARDCRRSG